MPWYIVQTKPLCEQQVKARWDQAGYENFLPLMRTVQRGKKGGQPVIRALFPSYLFVNADLNDATHFKNIKYTRGVRWVLGGRDMPVPVHPEIIDIIRERVDEGGLLEQQLEWKKGQKVRVLAGPLADLVGVLERPVSDAGRVRVLLEVYSKTIRADVPWQDVERFC